MGKIQEIIDKHTAICAISRRSGYISTSFMEGMMIDYANYYAAQCIDHVAGLIDAELKIDPHDDWDIDGDYIRSFRLPEHEI